MTALALAIKDVLRARDFGIANFSRPQVLVVENAYQQSKIKLGEGQDIKLLTPQEKEHWVNLARETAAGGTWNNLSQRDLKRIGQCLWHGKTSPLSSDEGFLQDFLKVCHNKIRKKLCLVLMREYLSHYEKEKLGIHQLGQWLALNVVKWDWHWADKQKLLNLFGNENAPPLIADTIFTGHENIRDILEKKCGINNNLQSAGMAQAAFGAAFRKFGSVTKNSYPKEVLSYLQRLLEWASIDGKSFTYPLLKTSFIDHLLLPWESNVPDPDIRGQIQGFLVERFGDPRMGGASWQGVNENAMRVIRGWLVERALAQFLDVVGEDAVPHQWKYRRAFWMAYYQKNAISDAWVAFGGTGAKKADQLARRNKDNSWLSFGRLYGSSDQKHAVLILRIGDVMIADYSHNGSCRIWKRGNEKAPKPYEKDYDHHDFLHGNADSVNSHDQSQSFLWQRNVAGKIAEMAGVSISQKEYTPR